MSQHDMNIANQGFPAFRSDLNDALAALASTSAGATAPSTTFAQQLWYDSTANLLKMRNTDNDAWITLAYFDQTNDEWEIRSAVIQAVDSAGVTIKNDGGTTLIQAKDDGSVVFRTDDVTVDASGNLLVGTTDGFATISTTSSESGHVFIPSGGYAVARAGAPIYANRTGSDGDIAIFRKDGSTVGTIGNNGTKLYVSGASGDGALSFNQDGGVPQLIPSNNSGTIVDDTVTLGNINYRFKDLFLSGGVYLGGTGIANRLDDYEEGTWTPVVGGSGTFGSASYTNQDGSYTKVGNVVFYACDLVWSGGTGSGGLLIGGLPFTVPGGYSYTTSTLCYIENLTVTSGHLPNPVPEKGQSYLTVYSTPTGGGTSGSVGYDVAARIICSGFYYVS